MAEAELFGLATDVLKSLATQVLKPGGSLASQEIQLFRSAKGELQSLEGTVKTIQAVLLDAEKQQWHNHQVKLWLKRLKDVLYDIQDLLDDVATQGLRWKDTSGNKMSKEVRALFSKSNQFAYHLKVANKIEELRKKLAEIANDKNFHLEQHLNEATVATMRKRKTIPFVHKEEIIGREKDKMNIISRLLDSSPNESVSVVPIVGIGGVGKTALAKLVYNDDEVRDGFKLKIWVCLSDIFDEDLIIKEILKSAQYEYQGDLEMRKLRDIENKSKDQLQRLLLDLLDGKKYLLVFDDVWSDDRERWWEICRLLMNDSLGSKILITTRYQSVVQAIDAEAVIHFVDGLSEDDSWKLFKKMAFGDSEESFNPKLEQPGRGIVEKCGHVPLAIKSIGSLLYSEEERSWLSFEEHELSKINIQGGDGTMELLKLSYDNLPSRLKHCFAYCALFPKHHVFDKQTMIQLWMAQGFIESLDRNDDLEETGDSYVSELLFRSFLEVEKVDHSTGEVKMFKMHYLMHDLALKAAGDECKLINLDERDIGGGIRHASFASQSSSLQKATSLPEATNLRTFLSLKKSRTFAQNLSPSEYQGIFFKFQHCRVLGLGYADFSIPPLLGSLLKHLRFLDVSENRSIESLPDSITDLLNLQTLKLSGCKNLTTLPRDLRKLVNLRHLLIDGCASLSHMPRGLSNLSSLQTLSRYILQKMDHKVPGGVGRVDELSGLNGLAGSITLEKLEFLQPTLYKGHLKEKQCLHSLELKWSWEEAEQQDDKSESDELIVWENLRPHQNLARLTISGCMGRNPPNWLSSMKNLVDLVLWACTGWKYLPPLSELPSLRKLDIVGLDALEFVQFTTELPFFPSLERVFLLNCGSLKGWLGSTQLVGADQDHRPNDLKSSFPRLLSVEIWSCPHLNSMPLFPWIEKLNIDAVSPNFLEQHVLAVPNYPSETAATSTFNPLSALKDLYFGGVVELEQSILDTLLPFLSNLKSLSLHRCVKLRSLSRGMQYLSSLQHLDIWGCKELDLSRHDDEHGTQWRSLAKLRGLRIGLLQKLVALPEGIRHVTTLQSLEIEFCENLASLPKWIVNFSLLEELEIIGCPSLTCLPNGMRHLTSLKKLRIFGCPALAKRCQTDGEDWGKIAHIPSLSIEGVKKKRHNRNPNLIDLTRMKNFRSSLVGFPFSSGSK